MKTRLSASAAEAAKRNREARYAEMNRMAHRVQREPVRYDYVQNLKND
jgi:hypothetical protein